jgi:signal transduction histidine kinase
MNPGMIDRVLENLVQNALRYGDGSPITLRAVSVDDAVEVSIQNTGKPIPESDRGRLFEPFYRGDRGRNSPGSGLGLSTARLIVESHGWRIRVESGPTAREGAAAGRTAFVVHIPL